MKDYRECVGILLLNHNNNVFAARRIDVKSEYYQMPQGGVDKGEPHLRAASRELYEETGIKCVKLLADMPHYVYYDFPQEIIRKLGYLSKYKGQRQRWFAFRIMQPDTSVNLSLGQREFASWEWMTSVQVMNSAIPFKYRVYKSVFDYFRFLF